MSAREPGRARLRSFVRRRGLTVFLTALLIAAAWGAHAAHGAALGHPGFISGWVLVGLMLFLTAYNLRKKLDFLPALASSRHWLWAHLIGGYLSLGAFVLHVGLRLPEGPLETVLWAQFLLVIASGVFGHYASRRFPPLLADRGQEVLYERIPALIRARRERIEALMVEVARAGDSPLPDFYQQRVAPYFAGPCHALSHLLESRRPVEELLRGVAVLERVAGPGEREALLELREAIEAKSDADYHWAHQTVLKVWLFGHVPLAYSLLLVMGVHVVLAYAYGGIS